MNRRKRIEAPAPRTPFRRRTLGATVLSLVILALMLLAGLAGAPGPALAEEAVPSASPDPTPDPTPFAAPAGPTITSPANGALVGSAITRVSGTGTPGQELQLLDPSGGDALCIAVPDAGGDWTCTGIPLPSGPSVTLRVVVTGDSALAAEISVAVLAAPTITGGARGQTSSNGMVRGTGYPGASVTVSLSGGQQCRSTVDDTGNWVCLFRGPLETGDAQVTATQSTDFSAPSSSNESTPITIFFDMDAPAAPRIGSPTSGDRVPLGGARYSGTGETGARVTVFAGAYSICSATVEAGSWRCSGGGVAAGSYAVTAVQQDVAGNVSAESSPVTVAYGAMTSSPTPSPSGGGEAVPQPAPAPVPPGTSPTPAPSASPETDDSGAAPARDPGGWDDATRFASAVTPPGAAEPFSWLRAALWALGALLLFALPARLLAGTISRARGGRPLRRRTPLTGRNQAGEQFEVAPSLRLNRWMVGTAALVAAATLIMLSGPVVDRPAYVRLLVGVIIGLAVVNAAGTLAPLWWSRHVLHAPASVVFLPRYLLLVGVTALASRVFEIEPALLFGLLGTVAITDEATTQRSGQLAAVRAGSLILLAVVGWLVLGALPTAAGFLSALGAEVTNAIVLAAIGSAVLVLIPLGHTSGRSILAWSPPIWAALTVLANTFLFAVLSPAVAAWQNNGTVTLLWALTGAFAAISVGAWAWQRYVAPAIR